MEANVSDELIEAMARELAKADNIEICSDAIYALSAYGIRARALLPVIRDHLEPTSEMVDAATGAFVTAPCEPGLEKFHDDKANFYQIRAAIIAALAASPIG